MREIEGIQAAMDILKPYWGEIEQDFNLNSARFLELFATDHHVTGRVLRSHLFTAKVCEAYGLVRYDNGFPDGAQAGRSERRRRCFQHFCAVTRSQAEAFGPEVRAACSN